MRIEKLFYYMGVLVGLIAGTMVGSWLFVLAIADLGIFFMIFDELIDRWYSK